MEQLAYHYARLWWWFNANAGAIQAASAAIGAALTISLVWSTMQSARLSSVSLEIARGQLGAMLQPVLKIGFEPGIINPKAREGRLDLRNVGNVPIKLQRVFAVIHIYTAGQAIVWYEVHLDRFDARVLLPTELISEVTLIPLRAVNQSRDAIFGIRVVCSDLSGKICHQFVWQSGTGMWHKALESPLDREIAWKPQERS